MMTKAPKAFLIILVFVTLLFIRNIAFWSDEQTFIFADTAIYALYLSALSENFFTIFSLADNFYFWNQNYLSIGMPTLSIIDLGYLYPPNILIAFISKLLGNNLLLYPLLTISAVVHLAFGGYFVQKILKVYWKLHDFYALIGGFLWVYIGFNVEYASATSVLFSGSFLPICFYLNLRYKESGRMKHFFLFYVFLALSFLVGYPMPAIITFLVCVSYNLLSVAHKIDKKLLFKTLLEHADGFFLITLPIISPLYFSSILNFPRSVRGTVLTLEGFLSNATSLQSLLESLLPINTPFSATSTTNITHIYISFVVIIIILQAKDRMKVFGDRRNFSLFIIGLIGFIFALGGITSIPSLVYFSTPVISFFRRLSIFSLIPGFAICIITPQYVESAFSRKDVSRLLLGGIKILVLLFVSIQLVRILYGVNEDPLNYTPLLQSLSIIGIVAVTTIAALFSQRYNPRLAKGLLVLALLIESGTVIAGRVYLNSSTNPARVFAPNDLTSQIHKITKPGERVNMLDTQHNYSTDYLGIENTAGYVALASEYGVRINEAFNADGANFDSKNLRDILGVKYVVKKEELDNPSLKLVKQIQQNENGTNFYTFNYNSLSWFPDSIDTTYKIYENPTALPRLYLASNVLITPEHSKYLLGYTQALEDTRTVFIKQEDIENTDISQEGEIKVKEFKRNYIKATVKSDKPTFLANSTGYYPGWRLKINGEWTKPTQVNWFMMGTFLPNGENTVEFIYLPFGVILGAIYIFGAAIVWKTRLKYLKKETGTIVD